MAHTYQLGLFPKQYHTMLPRGLQQNKTLISLNVIVISYSLKRVKRLPGLESRGASPVIYVQRLRPTDKCGGRPEWMQLVPATV